ncbi:MAG: nucleotidyltransferase domain-containing protein [Lachnospiraceae bacterium]|nr:nucleotidyltransferase domain-containing protein [Lachnospiraceae bacterium]
MTDLIKEKLKEIEKDSGVRILLAVESGSRAWGFASPDSDYDVRFIYVRKKEDYLRLDEVRDVIELPINDMLDINGWDLPKALRLMFRSNPTLFEWLTSPIVYAETEEAGQLRGMIQDYFSVKKSLYHYASMAESNYRGYLKSEKVKAKKYFYVLRPLLASRWIIERKTPPPMAFSELLDAELPDRLRGEVDRLLDLKMNSPETRLIPRVEVLNKFMDDEILRVKELMKQQPDDERHDWEGLNRFFLRCLR